MFLANGFDDYISKPVDGKTLESVVQKFLPEDKVLPITHEEFDFDDHDNYTEYHDYYEPHGDTPAEETAAPPATAQGQTESHAAAPPADGSPSAATANDSSAAVPAEAPSAEGGEAPAEAPATEAAAAPEGSENAPAAAEAGSSEAAGYDPNDEQIDLPTAMKYCGGMEAMQLKFLQVYVSRYQLVRDQLQKDFDEENIPDYTTHVHALKSTSLSIGGVKLSEAAKALEMAGHAIQDGPEEEKQAFIDYIKENHGPTMEMYAKLIEEAKTRFGIVPE
jgi:HPt (histidine-containing phosphotransfer) domain-containing protein